MTALTQRKIAAWACGASIASIWACPDHDGIEVERLIPGLLFGTVVAVNMIRKEHPIPSRTTLAVSVTLFALLIIWTAFSGPSRRIPVFFVISAVFLTAQWFHLKSFDPPATAP